MFFYNNILKFWLYFFCFIGTYFISGTTCGAAASAISVSKWFNKFSSSLVNILFSNKSPKLSLIFGTSSAFTLSGSKWVAASKTPSTFSFLASIANPISTLSISVAVFIKPSFLFLKSSFILLVFLDLVENNCLQFFLRTKGSPSAMLLAISCSVFSKSDIFF